MNNVVAMTGHRPEGIQNANYLRTQIRRVLGELRVECLINGLAAGVDLWAAYEAIRLGVPVISARPWAGQAPSEADRRLYDFVVSYSREVVNVNESEEFPGNWCYQKRNEWMVDRADKVFAVLNTEKGGTYNTFKYALGKKPILRYREGYGFATYDAAGKLAKQQWA